MTDGEVNLHQQLVSAIEHQKRPTVTVLSSLLSVQDSVGYIPSEAIDLIATKMDTTINEVWGVASFYTNFRFSPPKLSTIEICWGPTCHLLGATKLLETAQRELDLETEGDSQKGDITLKYNTCLGACAQGPVININHKIIGSMTPEKISPILSEFLEDHS